MPGLASLVSRPRPKIAWTWRKKKGNLMKLFAFLTSAYSAWSSGSAARPARRQAQARYPVLSRPFAVVAKGVASELQQVPEEGSPLGPAANSRRARHVVRRGPGQNLAVHDGALTTSASAGPQLAPKAPAFSRPSRCDQSAPRVVGISFRVSVPRSTRLRDRAELMHCALQARRMIGRGNRVANHPSLYIVGYIDAGPGGECSNRTVGAAYPIRCPVRGRPLGRHQADAGSRGAQAKALAPLSFSRHCAGEQTGPADLKSDREKTMTTLKVLLTSSALLLSATISAGAQQPPRLPHPLRLRPPPRRLRLRRPHRWSMGRRSPLRRQTGSGRRRGGSQEEQLERDDRRPRQRWAYRDVATAGRHAIRVDPYRSRQGAHGTRVQAPTKALDDTIAAGGGGLRLLSVGGVTAIEGGIPIVVDGKIVGSIGVSGVTAQQDAQIARAGRTR